MKIKQINIFILLSILMISSCIYAQNSTIDSLKLALKNAKHDTTRCNILNTLIEQENDITVWPKYNAELLLIVKQNLSTSPSTIFYLKKLATVLGNFGFLAQQQSNLSKASVYYHKALNIQKAINDKLGMASSLNNIGYSYSLLGDIPNALDYYHRSLKIVEVLKDKQGLGFLLNNIGHLYENQGDVERALEYYNKSLKIRKEIDDKYGIGQSLVNIGFIYENKGDGKQALDYYTRSLKIRTEINDKVGIANSLNNVGSIYFDESDYDKTLEYYYKSLAIKKQISDRKGIASSLSNIAGVFIEQGKFNEALKIASESMKIAKEIGFPKSIINVSFILKKIYRKQNNYKAALEMYELEIQMRDSINNEETKKASIKKQFQYEYEKQAAADSVKHGEEQKVKNAQLTAQSASLKQEKTQRYALYGGLLLVIAFSVFVFNRFRITQKQKKIIEEQKVLVDNAYESLHEKNKEVMDSIHYARRIQSALLTPESYIDRALNKLNKKS